MQQPTLDYQCPDCGKCMALIVAIEQRCNCTPPKRYKAMFGPNGELKVERP
jgi:hypothetical protein